jgi:ankyrin repeat protein
MILLGWDAISPLNPSKAAVQPKCHNSHHAHSVNPPLLSCRSKSAVDDEGGPGAPRWTKLTRACRQGYAEKVQLILREGADPNEVDGEGCSPLMAGVIGGNAVVVELLLSAGANAKENSPAAEIMDHRPLPVAWAVLVESDSLMHHCYAPLSLAAAMKLPEITMLLLDGGAEIENSYGPEGLGPLEAALVSEDLESTLLLLEKGAEVKRVEAWEGRTVLHTVSSQAAVVVTEELELSLNGCHSPAPCKDIASTSFYVCL